MNTALHHSKPVLQAGASFTHPKAPTQPPSASLIPPAQVSSSSGARQLAAGLILPCLVAIFSSQAQAQETRRVQYSDVTIQDTQKVGAIAEVVFHNSTADSVEVASFALTLDGLSISVRAVVGLSDPDTIEITPPEGVIAVPDTLTIADGTQGTVHLYPLNAVGF